MEFLTENRISFVKISTLIIGICNVYFIGSEYQVESKLDIAYFSIVILLFSVSLLWTLAILLIGISPAKCLHVEMGVYIVASLLYLAGVICYIVSFTKEDTDEFQGGKIVSSVLGFISVILYGSGSIFIYGYILESSKDSDA